jgi:uncharacterized protein YndB with AHSA1/START domain
MLQEGYLLIADISGYTAFFTQTELDHAHEVLEGLVEAMLAQMEPFFTIAKLEGDAIFATVPAGKFLQPQSVLEALENVYAVFRATLERMHFNTTCTCRACQLMPTLDLKFVVHYGQFIIGKRQELSGPDVILIHRLLKNTVCQQTGFSAYAYLTQPACGNLGLDDLPWQPHTEVYEHLGTIEGNVLDLHPVWERRKVQFRVEVLPEQADVIVEFELPAPPELAWDYLTNPEIKRQYREAGSLAVVGGNRRRSGVGVIHHCVHGLQQNDELIVDWQPFRQVTFRDQISYPVLAFDMLNTTTFTPTAAGTRITIRFQRPAAVNPRLNRLVEFLWWVYGKGHITRLFGRRAPATLRRLIAGDRAGGSNHHPGHRRDLRLSPANGGPKH